DYEGFSPDDHGSTNATDGNMELYEQRNVFEDSILPCVQAGLATLVEDGYSIEDLLRFEAAPGHTPGNMIIRAESGQESALFIGDCMHTPIQILYPDANHVIDADPIQARATRRRLLSEAAERGDLLVPAHFPAPYFGRVEERG